MSEHDDFPVHIDRRRVLQGSASAALLLAARPAVSSIRQKPAPLSINPAPHSIKPAPLGTVRLLPSPYLTAVTVNLGYLHRLDPDRLLHNFHSQAGLTPKGAVYAGWESDTIGGHTLGHYLSALSLMHAQTGDAECKRRVIYIVDELALCQAQNTDGFVAGFTRRRGDAIEPGKLVFDEIRRGDIRARSFDLNGCWVPLYSWHKLMAGLLDAQRHCGNQAAVHVAEKLGAYIGGVFDVLSDAQIQTMLGCEHGGLNESFAELYSRTGDPRWLALSQTIYHRKVLEPLSRGEDCLPTIHANTQIPKLIGLARLHELTGEPRHLKAADFFWETVTRNYSYVIGGNADREYFEGPRSISRHITEQTCESCNSYNMMKLTRHLYAQTGAAKYFDYYERTHLNHILAQHHPQTGMFAYMVPLMSGSHREFSTPFDDFWCCVGTGMESHAKHGDSIFWTSGNDVIVNLYIPSVLTLPRPTIGLRLETDYPFADDIALTVTHAEGDNPSAVFLRVPGWCGKPELSVNGRDLAPAVADGYLRVHRNWKAGDVIRLVLRRTLRIEPTSDDPGTVAMLFGPLVLAGDLGPATQRWDGLAPVLVGNDLAHGNDLSHSNALARGNDPSRRGDLAPRDDLARAIVPTAEPAVFRTQGLVQPADLTLRPFAFQHDNNTAVYFRRFTETDWQKEQSKLRAEQARLRDLDARSVDVVRLGDADTERAHVLESKISYPVVYRGRTGRDARSGGFFECTMKARAGPLTLQATYWGEEHDRRFAILVDGGIVASEQLSGAGPSDFIERNYSIGESLTTGKSTLRIRFEPERGFSAGPVFGLRLYSEGDRWNAQA